jgi:hypothetical protein
MLSAFGEKSIAARRLHVRTGFVQLGAFPATALNTEADSNLPCSRVEVEYYQLLLQSADDGASNTAHTVSSSSAVYASLNEPSSITRLSLARPVHVSVRNACMADLPAMLAIVNHSIRESTANLDEHPYALDDKRPWFETHIQKCMRGFILKLSRSCFKIRILI